VCLTEEYFVDVETGDADPESGMVKSRSGSGIRIWVEHPGSYLRELRNNFLVKNT
jgi:hypothetical protein